MLPIATKSCQYSQNDIEFVISETRFLLDARIKPQSKLPWRAQIIVVHIMRKLNAEWKFVIEKLSMNKYS